jgi:DNA-directed RNA polymerase subunit N (RpoN/RPB10)
MNIHLENIKKLLQDTNVPEAEKQLLLKQLSDADKQWAITDFKLDRTEKVKRTTAILLEETIEELEQKRRAVEAQNRELEIETALERVRTVAMAMRKPADLLDICKIVYTELQSLGFVELRNAMINIHNDDKSSLLNYDYADKSGKTITDIPYNFHPLVQKQVMVTKNARDAFFEFSFTGEELKQFRELRKNNGEQDDPKLEITDALHYYFFSIGTGSIGISSYSAIPAEKLELLKRFRNVFNLSYQRYTDIALAETQARDVQIELALERVRARTMAMQKSEELAETAYVLLQQFNELGETPDQITIGIVNEKESVIEFWITLEGKQMDLMVKAGIDEPTVMHKIYKAWKQQKKSLVIDLTGQELTDYINYRNALSGVATSNNNKDDRRVINTAFFSKGLITFSATEPQPIESIFLLERFAAVFDGTYTRFLDLQKAEASAREAQIELGLERVRARAMAMQHSDELAELVDTVFKELTKLDFALSWCMINIIDEPSMSNLVWGANPGIGKAPESYHMLFEDYRFHHEMFKGWKEKQAKWVFVLKETEKEIYDDYLFTQTEFRRVPGEIQKAMRATKQYVASFTFSNFGGLQTVGEEPLSEASMDILARFGKVFDLTYTRFNDLQKAEAQAKEARIETALERVRAAAMALKRSEDLSAVCKVIYSELIALGFTNIRRSPLISIYTSPI